ncbi:cysteine rich repeat-containing protein [Bradyrhizobium sp.]|uniref:cysteine rich repeat-containing protein n=1 Tax=Bradyrhizobium sp. TaxID=376 RepID=UPI003C4E26AB
MLLLKISAPLARAAAAALIASALCTPWLAHAQVTQQMRNEAISLMQVCRADYDRLCEGVMPGGGRILACLHLHASQLSLACAQVMPRAEELKDSALTAGVMPK